MMSLTDVIFDFDGTIVDSAPAILATFQGVLDKHDLKSKIHLDNRLIGPPLAATIGKITGLEDPEEVSLLIEDFKKVYDDVGVAATKPYPAVVEQLKVLKEQGLRLHIATNKRMRPTMLILDQLGLSKHFDCIYAIDRVQPAYGTKSEMIAALMADANLEKLQSCYVGDRSEDAAAAEFNNLRFFLAAWGYRDYVTPHPNWVLIETSNAMAETISRESFSRIT